MMNDEEQYSALSWFIAGYLEAARRGVKPLRPYGDHPSSERIESALTAAQEALIDHGNGVCLSCGAEGVVILDGYFCERCSPGTEEVIE